MNRKDFEKAQNDYMKFWENENERIQTAAQDGYRAGVVWLLRRLMHTPLDEVISSIVTLHNELIVKGR